MRYRHGAVITKGGKILAQGHNHIRTGFSGPLSAHETIVLPGRTNSEAQGCASCLNEDGLNTRSGASSSYFSMHAEMHAIQSILRGARPHLARSSVQLGPAQSSDMDTLVHETAALAIDSDRAAGTSPVCSRLSDVPGVGRVNSANVKNKCDRALVEGAKREQQRIAFSAENEWCLKPRNQKRAEKEPTPRPRPGRCGAWVWPVGW